MSGEASDLDEEEIQMMRTDLSLHAVVSSGLRSTLGEQAKQVGIKVQDGVVTLTGVVNTAADKVAAERCVQRVPGVHAVVESLRLTASANVVDDEQLARNAIEALTTGAHPIGRDVIIRVENGWLILGGTVANSAEYAAVERALECVDARGMRSEVRVVDTKHTTPSSPVAPGPA